MDILCCQGKWAEPNIMGRDWLSNLKVSICNMHQLEMTNEHSEILDNDMTHKSVFTEGLGNFKGGKVTLHVEPQVKPKFFKAQPLATILSQGQS